MLICGRPGQPRPGTVDFILWSERLVDYSEIGPLQSFPDSHPTRRGKTLAKVRAIMHEAEPEIVEEWKWMGTPVFSHAGIVCTGETYQAPIDIHEGNKVDKAALKDLIRAAVALNLIVKNKPKPRRASSKRAG